MSVHPLTLRAHDRGLAVAERRGLSTYGAMIVGTALDAGCTLLWSEDMQETLVIDDQLRMANPFQAASA